MFTTGLKNDIPLYDIAIGEILDFIVEHYFLLRHSGVSSASELGKLSINAPLIRSLIRNGNVGERFACRWNEIACRLRKLLCPFVMYTNSHYDFLKKLFFVFQKNSTELKFFFFS